MSECNFYRDTDGFCRLANRCWAGKPCPKTQRQADAARKALAELYARECVAKLKQGEQ